VVKESAHTQPLNPNALPHGIASKSNMGSAGAEG